MLETQYGECAMSIGAVSSSTSVYQPNSQQNTMQQNFQALVQAIQSGNLSAAQQAYATLTQNAQTQTANGSSNGQINPFQQALASIGSALQSGNISGAQTAMNGLLQSMKAHHHHGSQAQGAGSTSSAATSTSISAVSTAANSLVNLSV
jgi:DNA-binding FadR family transcriptional regulator